MPKHSKYAQFYKCKVQTNTRSDGANTYRVTLPKRMIESVKVGHLLYGWFELDKMRDQIIFYEPEKERDEKNESNEDPDKEKD